MADPDMEEVVLDQHETDSAADPALDAANEVYASAADEVDVAAADEVNTAEDASPEQSADGLEGDNGQDPSEEDPAELPQTEDIGVEVDLAYDQDEGDLLSPAADDAALVEPVLAVPEVDDAEVAEPQTDAADSHGDQDPQATDDDAAVVPEADPVGASDETGSNEDALAGVGSPPRPQQREIAAPSDNHARAISTAEQGFNVHRIRRLLAADAAAAGSSAHTDNLLLFQNPRSVHFPVVSVPPTNAVPAVQDVAAQRAATDRLRALLAYRDARAQHEAERAQAEAETRTAARERRRAEAEKTHAVLTAQMQGHSEVHLATGSAHSRLDSVLTHITALL